MNLRERIESDLAKSLEGRFGLPVTLISPSGETQTGLRGQILYDIVRNNPDTGDAIVINQPVVVLRRSSLTRIPVAGENWIIKIPVTPSESAPLENHVLSPDRPPEGGRSIGFIRLYCQSVDQSVLDGNFNETDVPFNIEDWAFNEVP